jgi:hypothetical protein
MNIITTVSIKKIEANRRNALKSTGPKTAEGKLVSRQNAFKHGLLARKVVIDSGDGRENRAEFEALLVESKEHYQPMGLEEESLVELMVVSQWRWARAVRCELGEIRSRLDDAEAEYATQTRHRISVMQHFVGFVNEAGKAFERSSEGIDYLLSVIKDVRSKVLADGDLSEEHLKRIAQTFGTNSDFSFRCFESSEIPAQVARLKGTARDGNPSSEFSKEDRITLIADACNREKERLEELR